jgi:hypothetical protein
MYIRWKTKPRDPHYGYDENQVWRRGMIHKTKLYVAYLVKSIRVDGKPRQRITYLASIKENHLEHVAHQKYFWESALENLAASPMPEEQRGKIEAALLKRVPRPSPEAIAAHEKEAAATMLVMDRQLQLLRKR